MFFSSGGALQEAAKMLWASYCTEWHCSPEPSLETSLQSRRPQMRGQPVALTTCFIYIKQRDEKPAP
jgi:hypothetical protein